MNTFPESGRRVAHVLLDSVVAYVPGEDPQLNAAAANLALAAVADIDDAVTVTATEEGGVSVNPSGLLGGAMVTIAQLVERLAEARQVSREDVVAEMRVFLDS